MVALMVSWVSMRVRESLRSRERDISCLLAPLLLHHRIRSLQRSLTLLTQSLSLSLSFIEHRIVSSSFIEYLVSIY